MFANGGVGWILFRNRSENEKSVLFVSCAYISYPSINPNTYMVTLNSGRLNPYIGQQLLKLHISNLFLVFQSCTRTLRRDWTGDV